jgi:hypothetical protein
MISYKQFILSESNFKFSPKEVYALALQNGRKQSPEMEDIIKESPHWTRRYVEKIIKGRWKEAEDIIRQDEYEWTLYLFAIYTRNYSGEELWKWIKEEGPTNKLIDILLYLDTTIPSIQEYIIKNRPDLIGEIKHLVPHLRKRYKYELNTAGVDI